MSNNHTGNVQPSIDLEEHRSKNVHVKGVLEHGYIPGSDQYVPITAIDNGDGTYSMKTSASLSSTDGAIQDGASPSIRATVLDLTSSNPLTAAIVDSSGNQITSFGGGTQYADGAARGTATGTLMMVDDGVNIQSAKGDSAGRLETIIQDGGNSITIDYNGSPISITNAVPIQPPLAGFLPIQETGPALTALQLIDDTILADNAAFTDGTTKVSMAGFIYDEIAGAALTENDAAAARIDSKRAQIGIIEDATTRGRYAAVTAANAIKTDGSAVTQPVSIAATVTAKEIRSSTNTTSSVAGSVSVQTLIASNANRLGGTVYNDSSAVLYIKLGPSASTSDFTALIASNSSGVGGYYEIPFGYTGIVTGVWSSAAGNARCGELT